MTSALLVQPTEINKVVVAIVRVYIENGCRTNRKKARLKHLLETMSLDEYLARSSRKSSATSFAARLTIAAQMRWASHELPHSHIGDFPQKQHGLNYVGVDMSGRPDHAEANAAARRDWPSFTAAAKSGSRSGRILSFQTCRTPSCRR